MKNARFDSMYSRSIHAGHKTESKEWVHKVNRSDNNFQHKAILARAQMVADLIVDVFEQRPDVIWDLAEIERAWQEVLALVSDEIPTAQGETLRLASDLVGGAPSGLLYDALAMSIRRCTTRMLRASGMDLVVYDELVAIENRYAAVLAPLAIGTNIRWSEAG